MTRGSPFFLQYMRPAAPAAAPEDGAGPRCADFAYIACDMQLPAELAPAREWQDRLAVWFARLRLAVGAACGGECSATAVLRAIESGAPPRLEDLGAPDSAARVLECFARAAPFGRCELAWLFAALAFVDRLVGADVAALLERIHARVAAQILEGGTDAELFPYLAVCFAIIGRFFHKA